MSISKISRAQQVLTQSSRLLSCTPNLEPIFITLCATHRRAQRGPCRKPYKTPLPRPSNTHLSRYHGLLEALASFTTQHPVYQIPAKNRTTSVSKPLKIGTVINRIGEWVWLYSARKKGTYGIMWNSVACISTFTETVRSPLNTLRQNPQTPHQTPEP